jgi:polysaccharide biosynthesis protein PelD
MFNGTKWVELIVVTIVLSLVELYIYPLSTIPGNPLTLIVLLFGIRYGIVTGLLAALSGSFINLLPYWKMDGDIYSQLIYGVFSLKAILFVIVGYISGLYSTNFREKYNDKVVDYEELEERLEQAVQTLTTVNETNDVLEKRILTSEMTLGNVYNMLRALDQDHVEMLVNEVAKTVETFYGAKTLGVYHVDNSQRSLRIKVRRGKEELLPQTIFTDTAPKFFERLWNEGNITIRRVNDEEVAPLLAAPIRVHGEWKQVIIIQEMDLSQLGNDGLSLLHILIEIISDQLTKTWESTKESEKEMYYLGTTILKPLYFEERYEIEKARLEEFKVSYSTLRVHTGSLNIDNLIEIDQELRSSLREVDIIGYYPKQNEIVILLPATSEEHVDIIEKRIQNVLFEVVR